MTSVVTTIRRGVNASKAVKVPCKAATTANVTLSGEQTIDGIACTDGDRVLVKDQTDASENGIYQVDTSSWDREPDWDGTHDVVQGTYVFVAQGSTNNNYWRVSTADPITIGTTSVTIISTDPDSLLRSNLADTSTGEGASLVGVEDLADNFAGTTVEAVLAEIIADYAAVTNGNGASKIGVEDTATNFTATTVEAILAEIYTRLRTKGADLTTSDVTANILTVGTDGGYFDFTGTDTIDGITTVRVGTVIRIHFDAAATLTHHATDFFLPGAANITTAAGDEAIFFEYATGDCRCLVYTKADGTPVIGALTQIAEVDLTNGGADDLTEYDFTSIPSWVKRITIPFDAFSTSGTSVPIIQLGDAGGIEPTNYDGAVTALTTGASTGNLSTGFMFFTTWAATHIVRGSMVLTLEDSTNNVWTLSGNIGFSSSAAIGVVVGSKALSETLTQLRLTTVGGTDFFDGGGMSLLYE